MGQKDDNSLVGKLLLAMPNMSDPRFYKAVIYVCAHDKDGAMGLVINHVLPDLEFGKIIQNLEIESTIKVPEHLLQMPVICGGPVEIARGFLIHSDDFKQQGTIDVKNDIRVTGTIDALEEISSGKAPKKMIFTLGYAGWSEGQIEKEIIDNAWMVLPAHSELIFETAPDLLWDTAVAETGIDPRLMVDQVGNA